MSDNQVQQQGFWSRVFHLYYDGFRSMTVGKTLWLIIAIKVIVFFVILRFIFFPDFLATKASTDEQKAQYVRQQMVSAPPSLPPEEGEAH